MKGWDGITVDEATKIGKLRRVLLDNGKGPITAEAIAPVVGLPQNEVGVMLAGEVNGERLERIGLGEYRLLPAGSGNGASAPAPRARATRNATRKAAKPATKKRVRSTKKAAPRRAASRVEPKPIPADIVTLAVLTETEDGLLCSGKGGLYLAKPVNIVSR